MTARYRHTDLPGRLLVYCDPCREVMSGLLGTVLPLTVLDENPDMIMKRLYRHGATASGPGIAPGHWASSVVLGRRWPTKKSNRRTS